VDGAWRQLHTLGVEQREPEPCTQRWSGSTRGSARAWSTTSSTRLCTPDSRAGPVCSGKEKINGIDELKMIFSGKLLDNTKTFSEMKVPAGHQVQ
jgi:hypothetical protein